MIKKHKNLETTDIQEISYVESKENELIAEEYEISTSEINDASHATSDENIVMTSAEILEEQISDIQETVISISSNDNVIVVKEAGISVKPKVKKFMNWQFSAIVLYPSSLVNRKLRSIE